MENLEEVNQKIATENQEMNMEKETLSSQESATKEQEIKPQNNGENTQTKCKKIHYCFMILSLLSLIIGIVLIILYFTQKPQTLQLPAGEVKSGVILTINNDSIVAHFELVNILKSDLEKEAEKYAREMQGKTAAFQEKVNNYQINVQNQILTQTQMQNTEANLMKERESIEALQERYATILSNKERSVQKEIADSIVNATNRVNEAKYKADFVFATAEGSMIVTSNPALDITNEVIKELNEAYQKSQK